MAANASLVSDRARLARFAEAAMASNGRVEASAAPEGRSVTADAGRAIVGVLAHATSPTSVELTLNVDVVWPPGSLEALADDLRQQITNDAEAAGLGGALDSVSVRFHDVIETILPLAAPATMAEARLD